MCLGRAEGPLQVHSVRILRQFLHVHQLRTNIVDDGTERETISPALAEICHFYSEMSARTKIINKAQESGWGGGADPVL